MNPYTAIKLSLIVAFASTILSTPFAIFLGWILARLKFRGKFLLSTIIFIPLVLPPVVTGLLLLDFLGRNSFLGNILLKLGFPVSFSLFGAVIASFIVGLPLYIMLMRNSFESVDRRYEEMAMTLGYSPFKTFFKFTLPMSYPGIMAGAVVAFARALGEFGATVIVAGNMEGKTRTISLAIYSLLDMPGAEQESTFLVWVSIALALFSLITFELLNRWHKKRMGDFHV
ncbi:MAG: molybdate ABC transporter permease subunit [Bacteriovoracaceae bacterium]